MATARELHYEVRRRLNRFNSDYEKKLTISAIDSILTEAVQIVIQQSSLLYEVRDDIAANLDPLVVRDKELKVIPGEIKDIAKLPEDIYKLLRITCIAEKDICGTKSLIIRGHQTQKIDESLKSPNWKPSFEWEETIGLKANVSDYYVYHNKEFKIKSVTLDYIMKHPDIKTPSLKEDGRYIDANGNSIIKDQGLLLDNAYQKRLVCDVAELIAARDLGDNNNFQTQLNKIMISNNLYLNSNFNNNQTN